MPIIIIVEYKIISISYIYYGRFSFLKLRRLLGAMPIIGQTSCHFRKDTVSMYR